MKLKKLLPVIGIIIFLGILLTLDFQKIIDIFSRINPLYSFLSFFVIIPLMFLANIEWQILLKKQKIKVSFWYSIKNFLIGYFYGFVTPGAFGAYMRSIYLSEESGAPLPKCVSNIIIYNTVEFLAMLSVGAIGAIFLSSIFPYLFYIIVIMIIIVISLFLFFFKNKRSKVLFTKIVQSRIFATFKDKIVDSIESFHEDLPKFKDVILPFGISIFGWAIKYTMIFFIAKLFFIEIPFIYFMMIMAISDVIASIPISIYGIGTREISLITMFKIWNIENENIVSLSLFLFVILWLSPSLVGTVVTFFETRKSDRFVLNEKNIESFEEYMKKFPEIYRYLGKIVKKNIKKSVKKPYIVELGIGPGLLSKELFDLVPNAKISGVDPSEKMLKSACKNVENKNFTAMLGSSEKIPIKDNNVDIVVSRFSLTYWEKPIDSFNEIHRILKSDGRIVFEILNKDFPGWKLFLVKIKLFFSSASSEIIRYHMDAYKTAYTIDSVKSILKKTGFEIVSLEGTKKDWRFIVVAKKK